MEGQLIQIRHNCFINLFRGIRMKKLTRLYHSELAVGQNFLVQPNPSQIYLDPAQPSPHKNKNMITRPSPQ